MPGSGAGLVRTRPPVTRTSTTKSPTQESESLAVTSVVIVHTNPGGARNVSTVRPPFIVSWNPWYEAPAAKQPSSKSTSPGSESGRNTAAQLGANGSVVDVVESPA